MDSLDRRRGECTDLPPRDGRLFRSSAIACAGCTALAVIDGGSPSWAVSTSSATMATTTQIHHPAPGFSVRVEALLGPSTATASRVWELVAWASFRRRARLTGSPPACPLPCGTVEAAS